ncbi:MAG: DNA-3-methyladenine glycosylase family protein [Solirubrobacterales bacterium]
MVKVHTKYFEYGDKEISYLSQADPILGNAMERLGKLERVVIPDLFQALIFAIIGQQISAKAANTVFERFEESLEEISPNNISMLSKEEIQQFGVTLRKAGYIKAMAESVSKGDLELQGLYELSDIAVVEKLCKIKGIGVWTSEMLLLNSMERPDIVSFGDIAIRRGMMKLYDLKELTRDQFNEYKGRYSPYGSTASIYLWRLSFE